MNKNEVQKIVHILSTRFHPSNFIKILYHDRTLLIRLLNREERTKRLEERINNNKVIFSDTERFIEYALNCSWGCHYIIFECSNKSRFCQFGLADNFLWMDFPITPENDHLPYLTKTRKLLEQLGFSFTEILPVYMKYNFNEGENLHSLNANFGKDIKLAADFVKRIFEEIYKDKLSLLNIKLGST